jgi:hypothetical protein
MANASTAWAVRPLTGTMTASATAAGYDPSYVLNDYLGVVWKSPTGAASRTLTIDLGAGNAAGPDAALFFGCTGAVTAWTLAVDAADSADFATNYWSAGAAAQFLAGTTMPTHGRGVGYWTAASAPPARRYWRFTFASLASAAVTVGRLVLGTRLILERNFGFGAALGVRDFGSFDFSIQGVPLRRRAAKLRTLGVTFSWVRKDEIIAKVQPLLEMCAGQEPVALVSDPTADADRQLRCWFGPMVGDMGAIWRNAAAWEWRVSMIDLVAIPKAV